MEKEDGLNLMDTKEKVNGLMEIELNGITEITNIYDK